MQQNLHNSYCSKLDECTLTVNPDKLQAPEINLGKAHYIAQSYCTRGTRTTVHLEVLTTDYASFNLLYN